MPRMRAFRRLLVRAALFLCTRPLLTIVSIFGTASLNSALALVGIAFVGCVQYGLDCCTHTRAQGNVVLASFFRLARAFS